MKLAKLCVAALLVTLAAVVAVPARAVSGVPTRAVSVVSAGGRGAVVSSVPVVGLSAAYYLAYLTVAWNRIYHLYDDESEVFRAPFAGTVAALFDGEHTLDETMAALPGSPAEMLRPEYAAALLRPTGTLKRAAAANDDACRGWTPRAPVRMYAAHGDPEAVYANSVGCHRSLRGVDVTLTDVGDVDHITSLVLSIPHVATWFAGQR